MPNHGVDKISPPKHLVHQHLEVMPLVVVDRDPDRAVLAQQLAQQLQARQHHAEPLRVFQLVVVVLERALGVVGRVDEDALHLPAVERQQCLEGFEVVALNQQVVGDARSPWAGRRGGGFDQLSLNGVWVRPSGGGVKRHLLQQPVGHAGGGGEGGGAVEPVEGGHGWCFLIVRRRVCRPTPARRNCLPPFRGGRVPYTAGSGTGGCVQSR